MNSSPTAAIKLLISFLLLSGISQISAVSGQTPFFRSIILPDDITQSSISCLYQDNNNYMWIGTGKGLYRYDGIDFTYIPAHENQPSLQISSIYMSPDKQLWIGTRKGDIYLAKGDSLNLFDPEEGNPKAAITGFISDKQGNLWFSTYGEGVYYYDSKHIYNINDDNGLTDNYCYTINSDALGRIWTATDGGISVCSIKNGKKSIEKITNSQGLPDNIVLSLTNDGKGMWAGMEDAGICKVDVNTFQISVPKESEKWKYGPVNHIVTGVNWLWISTERNGIISFETSSGTINGIYNNFKNQNFLHISNLYADKQGNYWLASGGNLMLSPGQDQLHYSESDKPSGKSIHSVLHDSKGNIWFSNDEGLYRMNKVGMTVRIDLPLKKHTRYISLYEDKNGFIWVGTFGNGIFCVDADGKRSRLFSEKDGLSNGNILSICGSGDQLWIATLGGAYKCTVRGNPFTSNLPVLFDNYGDQNFPGTNFIYSVFIDSHKRVWFGTDGKGISMLENNKFENFGKAQGLASNIIYSITEDSDNNIWFSTSNAGIYCYNGKSMQNYSLKDGLSDLQITGLLADKNHHLIIVHNNGLDIMDTRTNKFLYYSSGVGMADIKADLNVCALEGSDVAWLGTENGLIRLRIPADLTKYQPSLRLDNISVFLGKQNFYGTHDFSYDKNHISFHFKSLCYTSPTLVKYQIRLKGFDLDWIETRNNLVTYSSLPPGNYTFEVRSAIKGDFSGAEIKSYAFTIRKPFWKTNLFIMASVICMALLVYFIVNFREKSLRRRDAAEREKIMFQFQTLRSQVNPHFLFNSFSTLITIIDEDKEIAIEYVEKLSMFFRDILDYRDKDLIPLREELQLIDTYYYLQKKRYCENLTLEISIDEKNPESLVPPMVLQMLVENTIKHNVVSGEKPLKVRIFNTEKNIVIINTIQPKKESSPSTGIGLANIRNRYALLGYGEMSIETSENEFIVKLPIISPGK
jgi:ligand-binding sensor domain-containing protein